ncbi:pantoate-beta-alanine ligase [Pleurotus ostreatus]|nr:pantoate-beta-alanine ligase [Pleurotus ostreatus]
MIFRSLKSSPLSPQIHCFSRSMSSMIPPSKFPVFTTLASYREWRQRARDEHKTVGFVPTMGALHDGHISLVKRSLAENDLTVVSVFVNPAQFAPHEDLATYPRTLPNDLELLGALNVSERTTSALFLPTVAEMYPSGIHQDTSMQRGTFVEVKGFGNLMEGASRPTFFRGVATVVTKLFNAIEPSNAYFGQKDIQQGLLLKRMCRDLLLSHPTPEGLHIIQTARDPFDNLALSSRNAYLSPEERKAATTLYAALNVAKEAWEASLPKSQCIKNAEAIITAKKDEVSGSGVDIKLDYIQFNDWQSFEPLDGSANQDNLNEPVILSGAMWVGKTRLIDNIILGDESKILS